MVKIEAMDHIVLRSADVERSLAFYCGVLGLETVRLEEWRAGKAPFVSVRITPHTIIDLVLSAKQPTAPRAEQHLDHFCLVIASPLDDAERAVTSAGYVITARGSRFGARGQAQSIYFTGPEGVETELRRYPKGPRD